VWVGWVEVVGRRGSEKFMVKCMQPAGSD
jgi:hypothetical protein